MTKASGPPMCKSCHHAHWGIVHVWPSEEPDSSAGKSGRVAERVKGPSASVGTVPKTEGALKEVSVGSNPTPSSTPDPVEPTNDELTTHNGLTKDEIIADLRDRLSKMQDRKRTQMQRYRARKKGTEGDNDF